MRIFMNRSPAVVMAAGAAFAALMGAATSAKANPVTLELTGVTGPSMGGVYTSPYTALIGPPGETVGQLSSNGTATAIYCDDFRTDVSIGQSWQMNSTNVAALSGLTSVDTILKFGTTGTAAAQQTGYMTLAYLAEELSGVDQSTSNGAEKAGQLSFAIWAVYDPSALNALSGSNLSNAEAFLSQAETAVGTAGHNSPLDYANVKIYTPTPVGASQEYLVVDRMSVPEPGVTSLLAAGFGGILGLMRRRKSRLA